MVPTGGDSPLSLHLFVERDTQGGFGEIPKPTVKVWMGEENSGSTCREEDKSAVAGSMSTIWALH